jgi:DNA-binding protein Fis
VRQAQHLSALWVTDPHQAARIVRQALHDAGGNQTHAASSLGISARTMRRWLYDKKRKALINGAAR